MPEDEAWMNISDQRLLAMENQIARLQHLESFCPSGLHKEDENGHLLCFSRSSDPCWHYCEGEVLWMKPVYFDEGSKPQD